MGILVELLLIVPLALPAVIIARAILTVYRSYRASARSYS
jgi:ABC-type spermidine/putrescine transport system permease subunit II